MALFERYGFEPVVIHTIEFSDRVFAGADGLNARVNLDNLFNTRRPLHVGAGTGLVLIARRKGSSALTEWQDAPDEWLRTPIVVEATTCLAVVGSPPAPGTAPADTRLDIEIPPQAIHHADGHEWFVTLDGLDLMSAAASSEHTAPIQLFEGTLAARPGPIRSGDYPDKRARPLPAQRVAHLVLIVRQHAPDDQRPPLRADRPASTRSDRTSAHHPTRLTPT